MGRDRVRHPQCHRTAAVPQSYPVWSIIIISIDVLVIYGLAMYVALPETESEDGTPQPLGKRIVLPLTGHLPSPPGCCRLDRWVHGPHRPLSRSRGTT
jgi:hypothetical protein